VRAREEFHGVSVPGGWLGDSGNGRQYPGVDIIDRELGVDRFET
jgi:hypothetical protein